jgi:adenylate cyclase
MMQAVAYGNLSLGDATKLAIDRAQAAVEIDPNDADAQAIMAFALWTSGNSGEAWKRAELALANNANSPWANGIRAALLLHGGHPSEARDAAFAALRLSPRDPRDANLRGHIALSHYVEHDYASTVDAARHAIARHPEHPLAYRFLAAALGQLGRINEAAVALRRGIEVSPESFGVHVRSCPPWFRPEYHEHLVEGLRKAGWQG